MVTKCEPRQTTLQNLETACLNLVLGGPLGSQQWGGRGRPIDLPWGYTQSLETGRAQCHRPDCATQRVAIQIFVHKEGKNFPIFMSCLFFSNWGPTTESTGSQVVSAWIGTLCHFNILPQLQETRPTLRVMHRKNYSREHERSQNRSVAILELVGLLFCGNNLRDIRRCRGGHGQAGFWQGLLSWAYVARLHSLHSTEPTGTPTHHKPISLVLPTGRALAGASLSPELLAAFDLLIGSALRVLLRIRQ